MNRLRQAWEKPTRKKQLSAAALPLNVIGTAVYYGGSANSKKLKTENDNCPASRHTAFVMSSFSVVLHT